MRIVAHSASNVGDSPAVREGDLAFPLAGLNTQLR